MAAIGVFASATRWPDLLVATIIAALILSAAVQVIRLARAELRAAHVQCELDSPPTADFELR